MAGRFGRGVDEVVVLNGSAEGFALLPNLRPRKAALVHPSFTEPEVALRQAGVPVEHVLLDAADGYALHPGRVPEDADLVVVGNPTNPTSTLHPREVVLALVRPGRTVVVDEAFMDAVPGEPESVAAVSGVGVPGLMVFRSLTKTWAIPGLRAGYALSDPGTLARLTWNRPQWPVGTLVLEAVRACEEPRAVAEARAGAVRLDEHRVELQKALAEIPGVRVEGDPRAPFLLLRVDDGAGLRAHLRGVGIAVRRGDTFPGLGPDHLRVAVRPPGEFGVLVEAVRDYQEGLS
ncbi:Rv2231c family pyridoxal phosphate-dependent protein CobC [Actinokineospora bangkokensis]|uniref:Rv2231c family pyridoxal phosphate-dependent protein CobC n=1 Tax=Actinokineospora bangkokensis TaxID=1193682 RepID=UPI00096B4DC0